MTDFTDYINRLAPDGETFLLVRQKPQLKDGQYQYHADGAIKATWPAMLPDAAWFCWPDLEETGNYRMRFEWVVFGVGLWNVSFRRNPSCSPFVPPVQTTEEIDLDDTRALAAGDTISLLATTPSIISGSFVRFRVDFVP